ncbi:MAG: hypothetical protein PVJ65_07340, partial [Chromatiales bacterium]
MKSLFYEEEHEGHEDGIASKLLVDVTIRHVDGRSGIEIATTAAQPRNDRFPVSQSPTTSSRAKRGDFDVRGVTSGPGLPGRLRNLAITMLSLRALFSSP